jgi:hypothetical protein
MTPLDMKEIREAQEFLDGRQALKRAQQRQDQAPQRLICAWCMTVKREGSLPASHGICDSCSEEVFGGYIVGVIARAAAPPEPRRVRWIHLWPFWSLFAFLLLCAPTVTAQVTAVAELRNGVAELRIANPTAAPLLVELSLYRDATKEGQPVALGDSVAALISPASFTIKPGEVQTVRIRVRDSVRTGELLRLATLFTPHEVEAAEQGMRLLVRTRLITKVVAVVP